MSQTEPNRTWISVLTPEGRGALAVVRVWGPDALAVADAAFRPARGLGLAASPQGRLRFGRVGAGMGDEVVAVVREGEPPEVEIHCHGGSAAVALVVEALVAEGGTRRSVEAWSRHSARSTIEAHAILDLARAPTLRAAEILLAQAQGALREELLRVWDLMRGDRARALAVLEVLIARAQVGLRLVSGWRVALIGRPNVGKSRLLNALAGYERAIVDPTPGTTRDIVTVRTALEGWPVVLADTAGQRAAVDPLEASGIVLARAEAEATDLVLLVLDRSEPLTADDRALLDRVPEALVIANKADRAPAWEPWSGEIAVISAERGDGLERLTAGIARRLVPDAPPPGAAVPFRPSHVRLLRRAQRALQEGRWEPAARVLGALAKITPRP
jgi:tRNA modification GTPase